MTTADLFGQITVTTPDGDVPAECIDVGWTAWQSAAPKATAGRRVRWRFWLTLWRHFGQAHFLVKVDNQYRTATSVSVRRHQDGYGLDVRIIQLDSGRAGLHQWLLRRLLRTHDAHGLVLRGNDVCISRHPDTGQAVLPMRQGHAMNCPEALLDRRRQTTLPLHIHSTR